MLARICRLCITASAFAASPLFAWGCHGHQAIALIALRTMTPEHAGATNALLEKFPGAVRISCGALGLPPAARDSTWADDFRRKDSKTGPWHYIDFPFTGAPDFAALCAEGCITRAITEQIAVFRAHPDSARAANALRFLIHLVGDVHQPMHAISNNDRGGNCIPVSLLKTRAARRTGSGGSASYHPELHSVWDTALIDRRLGARDITRYANRLSAAAAPHRSEWASFSVAENMDRVAAGWARESHDTAVAFSYANLVAGSPSRPIAAGEIAGPPGLDTCDGFQDRIAARNIRLNSEYVKLSTKAAEQRLEQAGVRLAALLDQLWDGVPRP